MKQKLKIRKRKKFVNFNEETVKTKIENKINIAAVVVHVVRKLSEAGVRDVSVSVILNEMSKEGIDVKNKAVRNSVDNALMMKSGRTLLVNSKGKVYKHNEIKFKNLDGRFFYSFNEKCKIRTRSSVVGSTRVDKVKKGKLVK